MIEVKTAALRQFDVDHTCEVCNGPAAVIFCDPVNEPIQQVYATCAIDYADRTDAGGRLLERIPSSVPEIKADAPHIHRVCQRCGFHWMEGLIRRPRCLPPGTSRGEPVDNSPGENSLRNPRPQDVGDSASGGYVPSPPY